MKPLLWIEGIIGCGKTTFANKVGERINFLTLNEPTDDNPYLDVFYKDPSKYAFGFQIFMLHRRYAFQRTASCVSIGGIPDYDGAILDRSLAGDRVFAKMHMQQGNISEIDWSTYNIAYEVMCNTLLPPTLMIYLDVDPEVAYGRVHKRNRDAESDLSLEYLSKLRINYEELVNEAVGGLRPWSHATKVMRLNWNVDTASDGEWDHIARMVKDYCQEKL